MKCQVFATDLDGTLIPRSDAPENQRDLRALVRALGDLDELSLIFVTGRHFQSVQNATEEFDLPEPDVVICDVGSSIYHRQRSGEFKQDEAYREHLDEIVAKMPILELGDLLRSIEGLRVQEDEKQGRFKLSFYVDSRELEEISRRIRARLKQHDAPYRVISSIDPFNNDGLIDLLPRGVSKAYALDWWVGSAGLRGEEVVFAGDSGNDLAALTAGYRTIVVGNAERALARRVHDAHKEAGWKNRLYMARGVATSGVLEGCRWFEVIGPEAESIESRREGGGGWGAMPVTFDRTHFKVWAPRAEKVEVEVLKEEAGQSNDMPERPSVPRRSALARGEDGFFAGTLPHAGPGTLYRYVLDGRKVLPDPASRFQPEGIDGASQVIAPRVFPWTDQGWRGVSKRELVIYELHVGSFTEAGTLRAAIKHMAELADLGVTAVELMPLVQSPGRWSWGYDGGNLFSLRNTYGEPDDLKDFVDACHARGLAVLLDVVYNHMGPECDSLDAFGPYFSRKYTTPWGKAFNYDGEGSSVVRRFILDNALEWISEYHLDGLRVDAVKYMRDESEPSILEELRRVVSELSERTARKIHLVLEANVYDPGFLTARKGAPLCDAIWCDCLMHSILTLARPDLQLTDRHYRGASDLALALERGYVFVGRDPVRMPLERKEQSGPEKVGRPPAGVQSDTVDPLPIASFVTALQTHDGVGNHPQGKRIHQLASKAFQRAAAALTLLVPSVPLIFMGEEWAIELPFPFFCDCEDEGVREAVDQDRRQRFPREIWGEVPSPSHPQTFHRSQWRHAGGGDVEMFRWYRSLLALRMRGLQEGWLSTEGMQSFHDADRKIFSLRYARDGGGVFMVSARLVAATEQDVPPVEIPFSGTVLLDSENDTEVRKGRLALKANHAVVGVMG